MNSSSNDVDVDDDDVDDVVDDDVDDVVDDDDILSDVKVRFGGIYFGPECPCRLESFDKYRWVSVI